MQNFRLKNLDMIILLTVSIMLVNSLVILNKNFNYPFKLKKIVMSKYAILDLSSIIFGIRKFGADIAWIQLLQYYGTEEDELTGHSINKGHTHHHCGLEYGSGKYYDFLKLSKRIINLDPYFYNAYLYSSACLAWNLNRADEGLKILDEAINNKPDYWQFYLYKQAIIYKKLDKYREMVYTLEKVVKNTNCPTIIKVILANTYKKMGEFERSLSLWLEIYKSGDIEYNEYAKREINYLRNVKKKL